MKTCLFFFTVFIFLFPVLAFGQTLQVGTIERPPFSFQQDGVWKGFSIDILEKIALINGYKIEYQVYQKFADMVEKTRLGENDISAANISVTLEREKEMDFSYPVYDSGLSMMILNNSKSHQNIYLSVLKNKSFLIYSTVFLFIFAILIFRKEILFSIFGRKKHIHIYLNQILPIFCIFTIIINYNIFFVQEQIHRSNSVDNISNYKDISKRNIGVILGSTSEKLCLSEKLTYQTYDTLTTLYQGLKNKKIEILIHDLPILEHHIKTHPQDNFKLVGEVFQPQKYAFLMPNDSIYKEEINRALLQTYSDGTYESIFQSYFE